MGFASFKAINQQSSKLKNQRAIHSNRFYEQGMALLEQVQEAQFKNAALLPQACELFINAIKNNREDVRPCFALAYVFLILQDFDMALEYLKAVIEKEPHHELAARMREHILQELALSKKTSQSQRAAPPDPFDALEDALQKKVRWIMQTPFPGLVFDAQHFLALKAQVQETQDELQRFKAQTEQLSQDYEVLALQQSLRACETHFQRLHKLYLTNQEAWALYQDIQEELNLVEQCHHEAQTTQDPEDIGILEENLEALYANQSDYANAMDEWSRQGYHLGALHSLYQRLGLLTQSLEDVIDEASERLL